ncbi:Hypothetical protein ABZS17H1_01039 [Kosakonia cowanii]
MIDYAKDIWRSLEKDVFPAIGEIPVQQIKAGAQCFPLLACPLHGSVYMQVHNRAQAAPGLARAGMWRVQK